LERGATEEVPSNEKNTPNSLSFLCFGISLDFAYKELKHFIEEGMIFFKGSS
jgi:hypothetical protein